MFGGGDCVCDAADRQARTPTASASAAAKAAARAGHVVVVTGRLPRAATRSGRFVPAERENRIGRHHSRADTIQLASDRHTTAALHVNHEDRATWSVRIFADSNAKYGWIGQQRRSVC